MVQTSADTSANAQIAPGAERESTQEHGGRLAGASQSAADAYQAARERASSLYGSAREAGRRTAEGIESNPTAVVVGGLALGALIGALVPASRRERELIGPVGRRITDTAREAALAAREAGREQLDEFTERALETVRAVSGGGGKD